MKMYSIASAIKEMQIKSHAKTTSHSQERTTKKIKSNQTPPNVGENRKQLKLL